MLEIFSKKCLILQHFERSEQGLFRFYFTMKFTFFSEFTFFQRLGISNESFLHDFSNTVLLERYFYAANYQGDIFM